MSRPRTHRVASLGGLLVLLGLVLTPPLLLLTDHRADLVVLCSNTASVCRTLASTYEEDTGHTVEVVRIPTSEALARLTATRGESEFDVWLGGPAEAHAQAERLHLLRAAPAVDTSALPPAFHSERWFGVYGGILSLCLSPEAGPITSWEQLAASSTPLALPAPLTSGTAATLLNLHAERLGGADAAMAYLARLDTHTLTYADSGTDPAHLVAIGRAPAAVTFDNYCRLEAEAGRPVAVVHPSDGTGFEIGAVSLPQRATPSPLAQDFLAQVVSDRGQALAAGVAGQSPVSTRLPSNISARLDALDTTVHGMDPTLSSLRRSALIREWTDRVYLPDRGPGGDEGGLAAPPSDRPASLRPADEATGVGTFGAAPSPDADLMIQWSDLVPTGVRTGCTALAAGLLATLLGAVLALAARVSSPAVALLVPVCLLPALVPAGVVEEALIALGAPPFSRASLVLALALNATPFAVLVHWFALSSFTRIEMQAACDLGAGPWSITRRLLAPRLVSAAAPALAVTTLMVACDTSATSAHGGAEPYLAPFARAALNSGMRSSIPLGIAALFAGAALVTAALVVRAVSHHASRPAPVEEARTPSALLRPMSALVALPVLALAVLDGAALAMVLLGFARSALSGSLARTAPEALRESALVLLVVIPVSALIGFLTARVRWQHPRLVAFAFLSLLFASPVAGGVLIHSVHSYPVSVGQRTLLPPLVGAGSPGGGLVAVLLANLILSVPAAHFLMSFALAGTREAAAVGRDAGASALRVTLDILIPAARGRLVAAIAALSALIMCMSAPSVFVVPIGSAFPPVALVPLGSHGDPEGVFVLGALGGACALAMIGTALVAVASTTRRMPHVR
ncbi:substrate-binding domain-containing protein [Schaalia sp. 19OD2882]|uniref:extracellular solute-binding protein n=1 Tax=Schaalia sp. 19OD2882 TaxID=2794089 RepID=UPI001C1F1C8F|nr:extracellular solute-binding protein [Schaalia sp. 19OD2882]QWW19743.1 substrate-binding domain-containing protein [Schaalia sp. 19OD2882]